MTTKEYVKTAQKARALLFDAYVEFLDGDDRLKACEKLWQSAAHALTAVAQQRGWECGGTHALYKAVRRLADELDEEILFLQFDAADTFRINVEYDFLEDFQLKGNRKDVRLFVERVLSLPGLSPSGDVSD